MDRRILEAAQAGSVENLHHLLRENPLIFHVISLTSGETPLHISCMAGHLEFVKEMIRLKPEMAGELNQDGFSPLHIASANGYVGIVREILSVNPDFSRTKGPGRKTALHYAAIKGKVGVIKELLSASSAAVEDVSIQSETALHFAVKNNQFEAFGVMVGLLKQANKTELLNRKDGHGNTILHLATSTKQREVVEFLLGKGASTHGMLEVNAMNKIGLTALDILLLFPSEAGDREMEEILRHAGANTSQEHRHNWVPDKLLDEIPNEENKGVVWSQSSSLLFHFKKVTTQTSSEQRSVLMIIAVLIAITTHQAGLSPPGGIWNDENFTKTTSTPHYAGGSILGSYSAYQYGLFLLFNSAGFYVSLLMIQVLAYGFPLLKLELRICLAAISGSYVISITSITPTNGLLYFFYGISLLIPALIMIPWMVRKRKLCLELKRASSNEKLGPAMSLLCSCVWLLRYDVLIREMQVLNASTSVCPAYTYLSTSISSIFFQ